MRVACKSIITCGCRWACWCIASRTCVVGWRRRKRWLLALRDHVSIVSPDAQGVYINRPVPCLAKCPLPLTQCIMRRPRRRPLASGGGGGGVAAQACVEQHAMTVGPGLVRSRQSRATGEGSSESERAPLDGWRAATPTHAELDATDDWGVSPLGWPLLDPPCRWPCDRSIHHGVDPLSARGWRSMRVGERTNGRQAGTPQPKRPRPPPVLLRSHTARPWSSSSQSTDRSTDPRTHSHKQTTAEPWRTRAP